MVSIKSGKLTDFLGKFLLYIIICYVFVMLGRSIWQNYQLKKESARLKEEISQIEKKNQTLRNLLVYYQSDSFREIEARQKLGLKKPNEKVINVAIKKTNDFQGEVQGDTESLKITEKETVSPNWQLWMQYIFN